MSSYNQNQAQATYAQQPQGGAFLAPPPPAGYPTRDVQDDSSAPVTTQSRVVLPCVAAVSWMLVSNKSRQLPSVWIYFYSL
ncbi:hypothetical protein RND71_008270 [Anisodus tanguticus]|uniref:Uncharacterized protein n=1 Tax=Anisodus tanguticus TaxID=243964 RepID=A0AAE1SNI5_9SOLA|nr:hypothetical protein RND71_008270 [Anisodus tanguticus]